MMKFSTLPTIHTQKKKQQKKQNINSKTPEKLSPGTLVTNYHKLPLLLLVVRP